MLHKLKGFIRKLTPEFVLSAYHYSLAALADFYYGHPSGKMVIIGITGTKGKTSTANFVWSVLNSAGLKVGQLGTATIRLGDQEMLNKFHMTMPGPFKIQAFLAHMLRTGCTHVVLEATSEGMKLWRHIGIEFDVAIFTNLTPEHLPSHGGSFEKYKNEKAKLFHALSAKHKILSGHKIEKIIIANADDEHAKFFLNFPADHKYAYSIKEKTDFRAEQINETVDGVDFLLKTQKFHINILGGFNVYNSLPAIVLAKVIGVIDEYIQRGLENLKIIAGRMEQITEGQSFTVIVDYAHEKVSMNAVLDTARKMAGNNKVIILLGAEGGGRDKSKRFTMGEAVAKKADFVICSNVDPYEDDPTSIVEDIAQTAEKHGKQRGETLFVIEDRRAGIAKALSLAQPNDIVVITGKGAEQTMIIDGNEIPWDDRTVVREELKKM